eukprot:4604971-Amphidinium_carterae.1
MVQKRRLNFGERWTYFLEILVCLFWGCFDFFCWVRQTTTMIRKARLLIAFVVRFRLIQAGFVATSSSSYCVAFPLITISCTQNDIVVAELNEFSHGAFGFDRYDPEWCH